MDIVDKLVDGLCGYKDVLIPASEEIQALRYQLATTRQQLDIAVKEINRCLSHYDPETTADSLLHLRLKNALAAIRAQEGK